MSDEKPTHVLLASQGRFRDAISELRRSQSFGSGTTKVADRIDFAELLERTGQLAEARHQLAVVGKATRLSDSERARCFLVDGLLSKQMGHLQESIGAFQQACRLAERVGDSELLCWCQLRLLGVAADYEGTDFEDSFLGSLRGNVERAAVPSVSIAHQIFLAEYHAKRGALNVSGYHGSVAESLLGKYPNVWLLGLLHLHLSCLAYLQGDYLASLEAARHAHETASESGHLLTGLISQADMAAAYLAVGQPARAGVCLSSALRQANSNEQIFGLLMETLAEAQLISGDLAGCSESLERARELTERLSQSRSGWHRAWNLRTEVRLLQRSGRWEESLSLLRRQPPRESADSRSFTKTQLEKLEVLALAKLAKQGEARGMIQRIVQKSLAATASQPDSFLTTTASLALAADGRGAYQVSHTNALRIAGRTRETSNVVELVDEIIDLVWGASSRHEQHMRAEPPDPLWRPTSITCHLDKATPILPANDTTENALVVFVRSLAELTTDPAALGEEALRCVASMNWIRSGALVESADKVSRTIVAFGPLDRKTQCEDDTEKTSGSVRVWLGSKQARRYELLLSPIDTGGSTLNCYGVARLLAATRESNVRCEPHAMVAEPPQTQGELNDEEGLFRSPGMLALLASAKRVAPLDISVLLTGESGTGKEVLSRIIHRASGLPRDAFVPFNCATVPADMVDSQLFGYRRGAFTGAVQGFKGVISAADGGTLLLDEVGELPLETQPKLLRFLDSGEIQPLGEAAPRRVRVRVIAATNADLEDLVQQGRFREDLYYRLNVVRFRIPPLRERREEVAPLISMFLARYKQEFGKHSVRLSDAAREHLLLCPWPGNVRQLSHEMRRLVALSASDSVIEVGDLDSGLLGSPSKTGLPPAVGSHCITVRIDRRLAEIIEDVERAAVGDAMEAAKGRLDLAAKRLGLSRKGLYLKRQRLGFA